LRKLLEDLAVEALGDGRYDAELTEDWSFFTPGGGVLLALALNAIQRELDDDLLPLSATTLFWSPIPAGRMSIEVRVLRRSTSFAQASATIAGGLEVLATFGRQRDGYPDVVETMMPDVPHHSALAPPPEHPRLRMRFFDNFEHRIAYGHLAFEPGWEPGPARYARWIRYREAPRASDGSIDLLAYAPIVDLMPPSLVHKVGPKHANFYAPSLDLTLHFFEKTDEEWFLLSGLCRRAVGGTASAQIELFDERGKLVAYATQMMMLRSWPQSGS
jgi:acyl-CoA thioesterase